MSLDDKTIKIINEDLRTFGRISFWHELDFNISIKRTTYSKAVKCAYEYERCFLEDRLRPSYINNASQPVHNASLEVEDE